MSVAVQPAEHTRLPVPAGDEPTLADVIEERNLAKRITFAVSIDRLAVQDPERVVKVMENRMKALESVRMGAIKQTEPHDWTLNQDKEGHVIATLRKSGGSKVRKYFGISTLNIRPDEVKVTSEDGKQIAEIWGDGICGLTGEMILNVRGARAASEEFVGRGSLSDLKEAARTNLENKVVRILAGMTAVSLEELKAAWTGTDKSTDRCYRGHGYGSSNERDAAVNLETLKTVIKAVALATGKGEKDLLCEATIYAKNGKKYWAREFTDVKYDWQITRALDRLKEKYAEPVGNAMAPAHPEAAASAATAETAERA